MIAATGRALRIAGAAFGVLLIVLAALTLGARLALPFASAWKDEMAQGLGDYLGRPVTIGAFDLAWRGRGPELLLRDVAVLESATRRASFDELLVDLDVPASVLSGTPIIEALVLRGASFTLDYAGGGLFDVHGEERDRAASGDTEENASTDGLEVVRWLLDARRVALLDTRLTFVDANGRPLVLDDIDVRAESDASTHRLRLALALPPALGATLEVGVDVARGAALENSAGSLWLRGTGLSPRAWAMLRTATVRPASAVPSEATPLALLRRLDASTTVELWGRWAAGELTRARARVDARAIALAAAEGDAGTALLDRLTADLLYRDEAPGWTLGADRVELVAGSERAVLESVEIGRGAREEGRWKIAAAGERLPFALLSRLVAALSVELPESGAARAAGALGSGALVDWRSRLVLDGARPRVSLAGDIEALAVTASAVFPGVDALDGRIDIVDNRGSLELHGAPLALVRGDAALALDAFALELALDAGIPGQARLDARATLAGDELEAEARGGLTFTAGQAPRIDLHGRYTVADLAALPPWLALAPLPDGVQRWFARSFAGGRAENGELSWFGPLGRFPDGEDDGVFRARAELVDAELAYLRDWPSLRGFDGHISFEGRGLEVEGGAGRVGPLALRRLAFAIDDLRRPVLALESSGRGELQRLLDFAVDGPLAARLGPALGDARGAGSVDLDLSLSVPIGRRGRERAAFALDGALFLDGNRLRFERADLDLGNLRGAIGFDTRGPRIDALRATAFGQPVSIVARSEGRGRSARTSIGLEGVLEASAVLAHYGVPLDRFLHGASRWQIGLEVPQARERRREEGLRLVAESDLVGTRVTLPPPLDKRPAEALPVVLESALGDAGDGMLWRVGYGDGARAAVLVAEDALRALDIVLGADAVRDPPERPSFDGIRVKGRADRVSFDGWTRAISDLVDALPEGEGAPRPIPPVTVTLSTASLLAGSTALGAATLQVTSDATHLDALIDNEHLAGTLRYPRGGGREGPPATLRLARIDRDFIDGLGSAPESGAPRAAVDPRRLPALDATIARLDWGSLSFAEVELHARPEPRGLTLVGRVRSSGATLAASGSWRVREGDGAGVADGRTAPGQRSSLELSLVGEDIGAALRTAGLDGLLADGEGSVRATLDWDDALYRPSLAALGGTLRLELARGRIVGVEPGGARLVGLFALQALPRRLDLDFRDVTADGLAFERLVGDVVLAGGVAEVELVQLSGPIGIVDVSGTSDLVRREYDQRITVLPRVSAALPVIGMLSGGASAGIGVLVAGGFLRALGIDLDRIGLREYALRGDWDTPTFEPLPPAARVR